MRVLECNPRGGRAYRPPCVDVPNLVYAKFQGMGVPTGQNQRNRLPRGQLSCAQAHFMAMVVRDRAAVLLLDTVVVRMAGSR